MKKIKLALMLIAALALGTAGSTDAQEILLLDGTSNPEFDFAFDSFIASPPTTTAEGIVLNVPASTVVDGSNFGGAGYRTVQLANTPNLAGATELLVTARLEAGNTANLIVALREDFENSQTIDAGEFFSYTIDTTQFTSTGFTTVSFDLTDPPVPPFNGAGSGAGGTNNGVLDGQLFEVGLQSPFGQNNPLNITIQSVSIVTPTTAIPEPSSLALLLGVVPAMVLRRRR